MPEVSSSQRLESLHGVMMSSGESLPTYLGGDGQIQLAREIGNIR